MAWLRHNLNRPPHAVYNGRISSRPQFSLRMLLLVTVMVCLAAATVTELPEDQTFARTTQDIIRILLCIVFPAMLVPGAVKTRGYVTTMCIGGLFAASVPLATALAALHAMIGYQDVKTLHERLSLFLDLLWLMRRVFVVMWAFIPCASFVCFLVHWLWRRGTQEPQATPLSVPQIALRVALSATAAVFAGLATVCKLRDHASLADVQNFLMITITVVFPALLIVGAVQGNSRVRTFCIGASLVGAFPLIKLSRSLMGNVASFDSPTDWSIALACLSVERVLVPGLLVWAPLFGSMCAFIHWGLQRAEKSGIGLSTSYDGRAYWPPQISLRMLLAATSMVCLVAAAVCNVSDDRELAIAAQGVVRVALCILLPAALLAGSVATGNYARTMYIGGLFAAMVPLVAAFKPLYGAIDNFYFTYVQKLPEPPNFRPDPVELWVPRRVFAVMLAFVPCSALACFFAHWFWRRCEHANEKLARSARQIALRAALSVVVAAAVATAALRHLRGPSHVESLLWITLTVAFPALLTVGAVHGTGHFRTLCIAGAAPVTFVLTCTSLNPNLWYYSETEPWWLVLAYLAERRYSMVGLWACAPLLGLTALFFHWLFQRGSAA